MPTLLTQWTLLQTHQTQFDMKVQLLFPLSRGTPVRHRCLWKGGILAPHPNAPPPPPWFFPRNSSCQWCKSEIISTQSVDVYLCNIALTADCMCLSLLHDKPPVQKCSVHARGWVNPCLRKLHGDESLSCVRFIAGSFFQIGWCFPFEMPHGNPPHKKRQWSLICAHKPAMYLIWKGKGLRRS